MALTTLRRRKTGCFGVGVVTPRYWTIHGTDDLTAAIYDTDGAWLSDRGTLSGAGIQPEGLVCIHSDSSATVGDGSFAWVDEDQVIHVWDVEGDAHYTHTPPENYLASAPLYSAGWVYWWECPPQSDMSDETDVTLYRARADLDSPTAQGTVTIAQPPPSAVDWVEAKGCAMTTDRCICTWTWTDTASGEVSGETTTYLDSDGTNPHVEYDVDIGGDYGLPLGAEDIAGIVLASSRLGMMTDADEDVLATTWPTTTGWEANGNADNVDAVDGTTILYGVFDPGSGTVGRIIESYPEQTSGSPAKTTDLEEHPTLTGFPTYAFLQEGA